MKKICRTLWITIGLGVCLYASGSAAAQTAPAVRIRARATHTLQQAKLQNAIDALAAARLELERSASDFGGHKKDALQAIENAVKQLRLALQFEKYQHKRESNYKHWRNS
jgi:hypothetical protein